MAFQSGPIDSGSIMLLMLENQQLAENEAEEARDAAHELGVAFLKIGNIYRGLQQSQEDFEDTVQWINAGLSVASVGSSAASAGSAAGSQGANANGAAPPAEGASTGSTGATANPANTAQATTQVQGQADAVIEAADRQPVQHETPPGEAAPSADTRANPREGADRTDGTDRSKEIPEAEEPKPWDYVKEAYKFFETYARTQIEQDDKIDKHAEEHSKAASTSFEETSDQADEAYDEERDLTREVLDTLRSRDRKDVVG